MQKCIATDSLDKVPIGYGIPYPKWISSLLLWYILVLNFMNSSCQSILLPAEYFYNSNELKKSDGYILLQQNDPYDFYATIHFWLKTTSQVDVIALYCFNNSKY